RTAKFSSICLLYASRIFLVCKNLQSITNAQYRNLKSEKVGIQRRCLRFINAARPAGQDNALGRTGTELGKIRIIGMDLAVYFKFADAPGDKLAVLRSIIENQNPVRRSVSHEN